MSKTNFNKVIVKTAKLTLGCLLVLFVLTISALTLFYPVSLARLSSSLGFSKLSTFYYELSYNKTNDIDDLYQLLNQTIKIKDDEKTVANFELLYNDGSEDYYNLIDGVDEQVLSNNSINYIRMYMANEDRYLKSKYVSALFKIGEQEKALQFAFKDFLEEEFTSVEDYAKINFIINGYIIEMQYVYYLEDFEVFNNYTAGDFVNFDFFNTAISYYNNIKNIYLLEYDEEAEDNEALKLMVVANRLIQIAETITVLDEKLLKGIDTSAFDADAEIFLQHINILRI